MHIVVCIDDKSALRIDAAPVTDVGIGLGLDIGYIHRRADGDCRAGSAYSRRHKLRHFMGSGDRDIFAAVFIALFLIDLCTCIGIGLGDRVQIEHVHRAGKTCPHTAASLEGEIENIFFRSRADRYTAPAGQFRALSSVGLCVFLDLIHRNGRAGTAAGSTHCQAAVAAVQFRHVPGGDGDAFFRSSPFCGDFCVITGIGMGGRTEHIHAYRAVCGKLS